jgi:dTDP-4-amino-4,6-dideoxygalactose transaminase
MSEIPFVDLKAQYQRLKPEIDARIHAVLEHGRFIMGPEVAELEEQLSAFVAGAHTISVSSGTDALLMALMADGVGPGDAVFLPAFTFTATAEVVVLLQAEPVFVDVERDTFNIDPDDLERRVEEVARTGRLRTRAVIPVDLFGLPANHERIAAIAGRHDLRVVDDAAQAMGASVGGRRIGTLAPLTATSFFPAKPLGGYGDGGAVFTTDDELAERLTSCGSGSTAGSTRCRRPCCCPSSRSWMTS